MAKGRSILMSSISGNLGGVEFAMTKNGMLLKPRKPSRKMDSPKEVSARAAFTYRAKLWTTLTPGQVVAWNAAAATIKSTDTTGLVKYLSGRALFMKLRLDATDSGVDGDELIPPTETTVGPWSDISRFFQGGPYWLIQGQPTPISTDKVQSTWVGRWQSPTTSHKVKTWTYVQTQKVIPAVFNVYAQFIAHGIELCPGEHIAIRVVQREPEMWPSPEYITWATVYPAMALWLKMDDNVATSLVEDYLITNGQNFTDPTGNPHTNAHHVVGRYGGALSFDGVDDCITLTQAAHEPYLRANCNFTITFWWYAIAPNPALAKHILSNYLASDRGITIATLAGVASTTVAFYNAGTPRTLVHNWTNGADPHWHHYAIIRRGQTIEMYQDGVLGFTDTNPINTQALSTTIRNISIGSQSGTGKWSPGYGDDFRLYTVALNPADITAMYNAT